MIHKIKKSGPAFLVIALAVISAAVFMTACNQDSLFADIAVEPPPVNPMVNGSATKSVILDNKMYVASANSKTIHIYSGNNNWSKMTGPGKVGALAVSDPAGGELFALAGDDLANLSLFKYETDQWTTVQKGDADSFMLQSVYGVNGKIFVGGSKGKSWNVFYYNGTELKNLIVGTAALSGAAFEGEYYIATDGDGIYKTDLSTTDPVTSPNNSIKGILDVNGTVTAVTSSGEILGLYGTEFTSISSTSDYQYTGAMSLWKKDSADPGSLLLLGVTGGGSYTTGYRELTLESDGTPPTPPVKLAAVIPGGSLSSVRPDDKNKYDASIARFSVHDIIQLPYDFDDPFSSSTPGAYTGTEWQPLIFASTAINGLYVLRDGQWNAQP